MLAYKIKFPALISIHVHLHNHQTGDLCGNLHSKPHTHTQNSLPSLWQSKRCMFTTSSVFTECDRRQLQFTTRIIFPIGKHTDCSFQSQSIKGNNALFVRQGVNYEECLQYDCHCRNQIWRKIWTNKNMPKSEEQRSLPSSALWNKRLHHLVGIKINTVKVIHI